MTTHNKSGIRVDLGPELLFPARCSRHPDTGAFVIELDLEPSDSPPKWVALPARFDNLDDALYALHDLQVAFRIGIGLYLEMLGDTMGTTNVRIYGEVPFEGFEEKES